MLTQDQAKELIEAGLWDSQEEIKTQIDLNPPSLIFVDNNYFHLLQLS